MKLDTTNTGEIVCPHCGAEYSDSIEFTTHQTSGEERCDGCDQPFLWDADFSVTYSTRKLPEPTDNVI